MAVRVPGVRAIARPVLRMPCDERQCCASLGPVCDPGEPDAHFGLGGRGVEAGINGSLVEEPGASKRTVGRLDRGGSGVIPTSGNPRHLDPCAGQSPCNRAEPERGRRRPILRRHARGIALAPSTSTARLRLLDSDTLDCDERHASLP